MVAMASVWAIRICSTDSCFSIYNYMIVLWFSSATSYMTSLLSFSFYWAWMSLICRFSAFSWYWWISCSTYCLNMLSSLLISSYSSVMWIIYSSYSSFYSFNCYITRYNSVQADVYAAKAYSPLNTTRICSSRSCYNYLHFNWSSQEACSACNLPLSLSDSYLAKL